MAARRWPMPCSWRSRCSLRAWTHPELETWATDALTPLDADGLADFMAGLHVVSVLLLDELHEATGEPPSAILQRLAILAEHGRGTPSAG